MLKKYSVFILFFFVAVYFIAPAFETIDDCFMEQIVSGKYGHHPSHLMLYSSPLYGKFIMLLYKYVPAFNWCFFIFLIAHLSAWLVALDAMYNHSDNKKMSFLLFIMLFVSFGLYFIGNVQFTTTAFLLGFSGLLLIIKKKNNAALISGIAMVLIASMIRIYSLLLLLWLVFPWLFYKWVLQDGVLNIFKRKKCILIVVGLILAVFAIKETGKSMYMRTESGKLLREFIFERGKLIDNPNFVYNSSNKEVFENAGWSNEDFKIFSDYYFDPLPPFNAEKLKYIHNNLKIIKPGYARILRGFKMIFMQYQVYVLLFLLIICAVLFKWVNKKNVVFFILQSGAIFVFLLYILYFNDFKQRVVLPLFYVASVFLVMYIIKNANFVKNNIKHSVIYVNSCMVIFILVAVYVNWQLINERKDKNDELINQISFINNIEKDLLVVHGYDLPVQNATLTLFNNNQGLKGKVYFTMPSFFMHYLTGSGYKDKYKSVFEVLCDSSQTVLLLHNDKIIPADELVKYCGKKCGGICPVYTELFNSAGYDLYLMKK